MAKRDKHNYAIKLSPKFTAKDGMVIASMDEQ